MSHRSPSPQQRTGYPPPSPSALGLQPIRATSASFTATSAATNANGGGTTPAGTPSRRQNKRSSVTVVWPDTVPPPSSSLSAPPSAASSRVSSAGLHRGETMAGVGGGGSAGVIPIPTAPKRPSINNGAFAAAAAAATAGASRDHTAAPSMDSLTAADSDSGAGEAAAAFLAGVASESGSPAPETSKRQSQPPPWLTSPAFDTADPPEAREMVVVDTTGEEVVDSQQHHLHAPSSLPPPPPPLPPQQQSSNTNGVCEGIVSGVRHAAGEAGLWGPGSVSGALPHPPSLPPLPPSGLGQTVTPTTSAMQHSSQRSHHYPNNSNHHHHNNNTSSSPNGSTATVPGRRTSGRFTNPALPQYSSRARDAATLFAEKRTSNPFASYSTDLLAVDTSTPSGTGGNVTGSPMGDADRSNTTDLILYQQQQYQQQQQQQQLQLQQQLQRTSTALQRNADECNGDLQGLLAEAHAAVAEAEARLLDDGLALIADWMRTRDLFFSAGSLFAAVGDADAAARCLLHATFINRAFHNEEEALTTLAMSVEQLKHAHPRIAVASLLRLAPCYAQQQLRLQTARCYRDAAELLETELDECEAAVDLYRAALEVYADTQVAAKALARTWEKTVRQQAQRTASTARTTDTAVVPVPQTASRAGEGVAEMSSTASLSTTTTTNAVVSYSALMETSVTRRNMQAGVPPPHYQLSTTVQRSLIEACRGRLLVLLTQLQRYPEVLEVALTCAEYVPRALPRTKFLLCATLSVLARGAPSLPPSHDTTRADVSDGAGSASADASLPPGFMSAEAEAADSVYFDSLYDTEKIFSTLQEEDRTFQRGKENALVRALLAANTACSLTAFDEAVRTYKGYATTEPNVVLDMLLEQCRRSLFQHVERFA